MTRTGTNGGHEQLPPRVASALRAAEIPRSKLGPARRARLSGPERELYEWILHRFATSGRPGSADAHAAAERLGLDAAQAFETFAREDLVHLDREGAIAVAYPFSGRPTTHRVRFSSGHEAHAMCAFDALGIAPMFEQRIEIASRDPLTDTEVQVKLAPDGDGNWQPQEAVVVSGKTGRGESCNVCCPVLNFFASARNAEQWLDAHPEVLGTVISMPIAVAAGRAIFGDSLTNV